MRGNFHCQKEPFKDAFSGEFEELEAGKEKDVGEKTKEVEKNSIDQAQLVLGVSGYQKLCGGFNFIDVHYVIIFSHLVMTRLIEQWNGLQIVTPKTVFAAKQSSILSRENITAGSIGISLSLSGTCTYKMHFVHKSVFNLSEVVVRFSVMLVASIRYTSAIKNERGCATSATGNTRMVKHSTQSKKEKRYIINVMVI